MGDINEHFTPKMQRIDVEAVALNFLGVSVSVSRNDHTGQLTVIVLTEDVRDYDGYTVPGDTGGNFTKINIILNDADIYDDTGNGDTVAREHVEAAARESDVTINDKTDKAGNI